MVDGLIGNIDVFSLEDFGYIGTLDINETVMSCSIYHENKFYVGTSAGTLFCFTVNLSEKQFDLMFKPSSVIQGKSTIKKMILYQ